MNQKKIKISGRITLIVISFIIAFLIYIILNFSLQINDHLYVILESIQNSYLLLSEHFSNTLLAISGHQILIENHKVIASVLTDTTFEPQIWYKKISLFVLLIIWVTKSKMAQKLIFSLITILISFISLSLHIAISACTSVIKDYNQILIPLTHTIALLCFISTLFTWYLLNKNSINPGYSRLKLIIISFRKKAISLFILSYLYVIIVQFIIPVFDFAPWINFLFISSHKILTLLGFDSTVEPFLLIGSNGSIYMAKYCLGIQTMLLFATGIYLTGKNDIAQWVYIIAGLIFLNIINILRFVFLFIHIQKNGDYTLAISVHDMYNYIIYFIVFVLWIIWFELFSELKSTIKTSSLNSEHCNKVHENT